MTPIQTGSGHAAPFTRSMSLLRQDIENSRTAATTGRIADPVSTLGARNGERLELAASAQRIQTIVATNETVSSFLSVAQDATGQVGDLSGALMQTLVAASGGGSARGFVAGEASATLESLHLVMNTSFAGRPVFGGQETGHDPLAPLDDIRAEFGAIFSGHFGFAADDAAAVSISAVDLEHFIDTVALPALTGASWSGAISQAGAPASARIGAFDTITRGPTVDEPALRNAFVTALVTAELTAAPLSAEAFEAAVSYGLSGTAVASGEAAQLQSATAITEARVEQASERLLAHAGTLTESSEKMVATDAFEAAARFNDLTVKLEAAYTMTARLQQLTLMRFLP